MSLRYTDQAVHDLERLFEFVARTDTPAAGRIGHLLLESLDRLAEQPAMGQIVEGYEEHPLRQWVTRNHIVRYRVRDDDVIVVRIWHVRESRQD